MGFLSSIASSLGFNTGSNSSPSEPGKNRTHEMPGGEEAKPEQAPKKEEAQNSNELFSNS